MAPPGGRGQDQLRDVRPHHSDDTGQFTEMCLQLQQQLSGVRTPALPFHTLTVSWCCSELLTLWSKCCPPRSTSEYMSAIVELSDLIMDRRLRILHHWDWIYWKTQQGKRFKKALSVIHRCDLLTFMHT